MITDTMSKYEVMASLRKEFDDFILPHFSRKILPKLQAEISQKCIRENKTISVGWERIPSSPGTNFYVLKRGNKEGHLSLFINEFRWNNKKCYANFFQDGRVVVYQSHCLERYAERVLKNELDINTVFCNIVKRQASAFNITLPTPTHRYSQYFGFANALFLGDFDALHPEVPYLWLNTCISFNEARYSQSKIMSSLHEMQKFAEKVKTDFSDVDNKKILSQYLKKNSKTPKKIEEVKKYLVQKVLLWKLHLSFAFDFTELFREEINKQLSYLEDVLKELNVDIKLLSPYSPDHGIAIKGEIDFRDSMQEL